MKRLIPILLILALALTLGGCGDFAPDPTETPGTTVEYSFDRSNFPTIAGGEAQRPLAEAIAAIMLGETRESASDMLSFGSTARPGPPLSPARPGWCWPRSRTSCPRAWRRPPSRATRWCSTSAQRSPVDGMTTAQLKSVLAGGTKSWSGMGGTGDIIVLGRPEGSGSLAAVRRLIGADELAVSEESAALTSNEVLGYGFYNEAVLMGLADGYKLLAIDGVEPTAETIASGEYPLTVDVLAGISSSAAEDSPERALWLWLQGGVGQAFISSQGYLEAAK